MIITDEIIKEEFKVKRFVYNSLLLKNYINRIEGKYNKDIYEYLINRYNDSSSLKETLYRIYKGIEYHPTCPICNRPLTFRNNKFFTFCSSKCAQSSSETRNKIKESCIRKYGVDNPRKSKEVQEKTKRTCIERYGVEHPWQTKECQEKIRQTCIERYGVDSSLKSKEVREKIKQTCIERYGVDNPAKSKEVQEKTKQTCIERYGMDNPFGNSEVREKIKQTCIERYGVDNPAKSKEVQEKTKQTCIERYGGIAPLFSNSIKEKSINTCIHKYGVKNYGMTNEHKMNLSAVMSSPEFQQHRHDVMKLNNTFNTSKAEDLAYSFLSKYVDVIRQYNKDKRYPWCCDFYIPKLDLFIECNFHWTHGKHPYNENNKVDMQKLNEWKSKETKYYTNAIKTWTIYDVKKRNKAKEEKLNFLEFWTLNEFKEYFTKYFETFKG